MSTLRFNFRDLCFYDIENFSIGNYITCKDGVLSFDITNAKISWNMDIIKIYIDDREIIITLYENKPITLEYRLGSINVVYSNNVIDVIDINMR